MTRRLIGLAFAGLAVALALSACGGGGDNGDAEGDEAGPTQAATVSGGAGGQASRTLAACTLVTKQDVEALIGSPAPDPDTSPVGPFQSCAYYKSLTSFVQFQVCRCLSGSEFDSSVESGAEFLEVEAKRVSGIGDKAYWLEGILWVQKGDVAFNVWVSTPQFFKSDGEALEGAALEGVALPVTRELAQKVLSRLN